LKKQKKTPANDAFAAKGKGRADNSPTPSMLTKTKQKTTSANRPTFTQQSGNVVVKAFYFKPTAKKQ